MKLALFAGLNYYPRPGVDDFRGFGTMEELKALYAEKIQEWTNTINIEHLDSWGQIVNPETMEEIEWCSDLEPWKSE